VTRHERRSAGRRWTVALSLVVVLYGLGATIYVMHRGGWLRRTPSSPAPEGPGVAGAGAVPAQVQSAPSGQLAILSLIERRQRQERRERDLVNEVDRLVDQALVDEAATLLDREMVAEPGSLKLKELRGQLHLLRGEFGAARDLFLEVLAANPDHVVAREGLAEALLGGGEPVAAFAAAQWALQADPQRVGSLRAAARAAIEVGQYGQAVQYLRRWLERVRGSVEARNLLGLAYLRLGEYGKAAYQLGELVRDGLATETTYLNLALVFAQQKQSSDVVDVLAAAAQRLSLRQIAAWFERPDFAPLHDDRDVTAFMNRLLTAGSVASTLRLPARPVVETREVLGMMPTPDLMDYRKFR